MFSFPSLSKNAGLLAITSGVLAATAGLVAKLGLDESQLGALYSWPQLGLLIRASLFGLTLLLNCLMITIFSKSLALSTTAAETRYLAFVWNQT